MIQIKKRWTNAVIYRSETAETTRDAVIEIAGKDLMGANLSGAHLGGA